MPSRHERLSATDAAFLAIETSEVHMHVGGVVTLALEPFRNAYGGVDFERVRAELDGTIANLPRMRQRLRHMPGVRHWAWVDDPHFSIDYHVRHTALPRPGDATQLQRLASRIFSIHLDRERPLWEIWVVEGLDDDRFALISKIHHCLLDGVGAVNLLVSMASGVTPRPDATPAPMPTRSELVMGELRHRLEGWKSLGRVARDLLEKEPEATGDKRWRDLARGVTETLKTGLAQADPLPINPDVLSPHRRFRTLDLPLADAKVLRKHFGCTINDIVLATVAGALRRYLARHGVDLPALTRVRALVPTSVRATSETSDGQPGLGNQVSLLLVPLPVNERDAADRVRRVFEHTTWLKNESHEAAGAEFMERLDDQLGLGLVATTLKVAMMMRSFNVVVTNVPGPPFAMELLGSPVRSIHALVPNFHHQGLGIAIFSYNGTLSWGFGADWDAVADVDEFVADVADEFAALNALASPPTMAREPASVSEAPPAKKPRRKASRKVTPNAIE